MSIGIALIAAFTLIVVVALVCDVVKDRRKND